MPTTIRVGQGAVVRNAVATPKASNVGITMWCGIRIRFSDTVGTLLTINNAIPVIVTALKYGERNSQSPHSKLRNIGIITKPAPAGAGAPLKKGAAYDGTSAPVPALKRARRSAQHTAKNNTIAQPRTCHSDIVQR